MPSVALITCRELPEPDHDEQLLLDALREAGLSPEMLAWDDPQSDPGAFDLCVLRSCWNYFEDAPRFLAWLDAAAAVTDMANGPEIVRWNHHKAYLQELQERGLAVVPTVWCSEGQPSDLAQTMTSQGWDDVVIKPSVSAGSYRTHRFTAQQTAAGQVFLDDLLGERDAMIQRTIVPTTSAGERALVCIGGELTHGVTKATRFSGGDESVSEAEPLTVAERDFAERTLAMIDSDLLYARVDVMTDQDGTLLLAELELMEPSLFLAQHPPALSRLVTTVVERAGAPRV